MDWSNAFYKQVIHPPFFIGHDHPYYKMVKGLTIFSQEKESTK